MTNRLIHYLQGCIQAIFEDVAWMYTSKVDLDRDTKRILTQLSSRGDKFFTLELPAVENILHLSLDVGRFMPIPLLGKSRNRQSNIPVFLESLYKRIFSIEDGTLLDDPCPNAILGLKTIFSFAKKVELQCPQGVIDETLKKFQQTDYSLPDHTYDWNSDEFGLDLCRDHTHIRRYEWSKAFWSKLSYRDQEIIQRTFDLVASTLGESPSNDVELQNLFKPGHGPGASSEKRDGLSKYNLGNWPARLEERFPYDLYASASLCESMRTDGEQLSLDIRGSRLIAVHKNQKGPRLIAAEPVSHMYIQKLLEKCMVYRFESSFIRQSISIKDQSNNKELAEKASRNQQYTTIDLSEASDRVSLAIIESFLRSNPEWMKDMQACRSPYVTMPDGSVINYKKFGPQGSAVTFPLQSLLYYAICQSAIHIHNGLMPTYSSLRKGASDIRIYGDDIIIKTEYRSILVDLLSMFHMKVNTDKSFWTGKFRESCGRDAYDGFSVNPPRIKEIPNGNLAQLPSLVQTANRFYSKGFWRTSQYIRSIIGFADKFIPISNEARFPVSHFSFLGTDLSHLPMRYSEKLHSIEYKVFVPRTSMKEERLSGQARLLQYFVERPDPLKKWKSGTSTGHSVNYRVGWVTRY